MYSTRGNSRNERPPSRQMRYYERSFSKVPIFGIRAYFSYNLLVFLVIILFTMVLNMNDNLNSESLVGKFDNTISKPIPVLFNVSNVNIPDLEHFKCIGKCPLCNFKQFNKLNNSNPRDFIFCFAFGTTKNILPFIRSLRTTGSKASVAIFLDDKAYNSINQATFLTAKDCGMQFYNLGNLGILKKPEIMSLPYFLSYYIIHQNFRNIDRLIIMDLFDSAFQADPFTTYLNQSFLHLSPEFKKLKSSRINRKWIVLAGMLSHFPSAWKNNEVICAGYLGGTVSNMFRFICEFVKCKGIVEGWKKNNIDQGTFNYLYLSGDLKNAGIPAKVYERNDTVQHFSYGLPKYPLDEFPNVRNKRSEFYPVPIVHHYYRSKYFIKTLTTKCPKTNPNWTNYAATYKK